MVRLAIAVGIIIVIACVAFVSILVGAVVGTIDGYASEAVTNAVSPKTLPEEYATAKARF